jgi:hypothetical protein
MKIKDAYIFEILVLFFAGLSGIMVYNGNWIIRILGFVILLFNSYFLITKLKESVIKELRGEINRLEEKDGK